MKDIVYILLLLGQSDVVLGQIDLDLFVFTPYDKYTKMKVHFNMNYLFSLLFTIGLTIA